MSPSRPCFSLESGFGNGFWNDFSNGFPPFCDRLYLVCRIAFAFYLLGCNLSWNGAWIVSWQIVPKTWNVTTDCYRRTSISRIGCRKRTSKSGCCTTSKMNRIATMKKKMIGCSFHCYYCHCWNCYRYCRIGIVAFVFWNDHALFCVSFSLLFGAPFPCVSGLAPPFALSFRPLFGPFLSFLASRVVFVPGVLYRRPVLRRASPC